MVLFIGFIVLRQARVSLINGLLHEFVSKVLGCEESITL